MCTAYYADLNARCGQPGVLVRRGCVHEHIVKAAVCRFHLLDIENSYCPQCLEFGHYCPVTVTPVEVAS